MGIRFQGIIAPLTTPFSEEGEIVPDALARNLTRYAQTSLTGFLIAGSTGESPHLTEDERLQLIRTASQVDLPGKRLLVGVSGSSLKQAEHLIDNLSDLRVDALLASVPSYYRNRMDEEALREYFEGLADCSSLPVLLYNIPRYTGIELSPALVANLSTHPNIVGMKDSSGNLVYLQDVLSHTSDEDFQVIGGSAENFLGALTLGVRAGILAVACVIPNQVTGLLVAFQKASDDLLEKQREVFSASRTIVARLGVAGVKYAMDLCGYEGLSSRLPLRPLNRTEKAEVRAVLAKN